MPSATTNPAPPLSKILLLSSTSKTQLKNIANKKIAVKLFIKYWGRDDKLEKIASEEHLLDCNKDKIIDWVIPSTENNPIGPVSYTHLTLPTKA